MWAETTCSAAAADTVSSVRGSVAPATSRRHKQSQGSVVVGRGGRMYMCAPPPATAPLFGVKTKTLHTWPLKAVFTALLSASVPPPKFTSLVPPSTQKTHTTHTLSPLYGASDSTLHSTTGIRVPHTHPTPTHPDTHALPHASTHFPSPPFPPTRLSLPPQKKTLHKPHTHTLLPPP